MTDAFGNIERHKSAVNTNPRIVFEDLLTNAMMAPGPTMLRQMKATCNMTKSQ